MTDQQRTAHVEVLLATYNGERFVREQIDSILAQDADGLRILASDDGSTDFTRAILDDYARAHPERFTLLESKRPSGSAAGNFLRLLQQSSGEYVCFADQDDVWLPQKVSRSLQCMRELESRSPSCTPAMVFGDLRVVDDKLKTRHRSYWSHAGVNPETIHHLNRLLGQSVVTGCTVLINRPMVELSRRMPPEATMHDRWIGLLAASLGAAAYLREPLVLYRQHGSNIIGAAAADTSVGGLAQRTVDTSGRRRERVRSELQAEALLRLHFSEMPTAKAKCLQAYLRSGRSDNPLVRVLTTLRYGFFRGGLLQNIALLLDLMISPSNH